MPWGNQKMKKDTWLEEYIDTNEIRSYRIVEHIYRTTSLFHTIEVVRLANQGITLLLDGHARVFESDEFIYHEALIHPSMHLHINPQRILLIGDGDGGGIRELLKYKSLSRIDWVEIDKAVYDTCRNYLPSFPKSLINDQRLHFHWDDGLDYVQKCDEIYDIVFISVSEIMEDDVAQHMYEIEALQGIAQKVLPNGYCVQSAGMASPGMTSSLKRVISNFKRTFSESTFYNIGLPAFGINWGFCIGTNSKLDLKVEKVIINSLRFYDVATHLAMFTKPSFLINELNP